MTELASRKRHSYWLHLGEILADRARGRDEGGCVHPVTMTETSKTQSKQKPRSR